MAKHRRKQQVHAPGKKRGSSGTEAAGGLMASIWSQIDQGQGKKALEHLKAVRPGQAGVFDLRAAKFCALAARAGELYRAQVLAAAVDAVARVRAQSVQLIGEALRQMSSVAQLHTIRWLPLDVALGHLDAFDTPLLQRSLVDRMMTSAPKDAPILESKLGALAAGHWLVEDSQACRVARALMHDAAWLGAQEALASVPRGSVFAPWRLFCRFMAEHASNSPTEAHKSGTMLLRQWPDFALASVVTTILAGVAGQTAKPSRLSALLFPGADFARRAAALRTLDARSGRFVEQVTQLGAGIYPADPKLGSWSVLCALSDKAHDAPAQASAFIDAAERFSDNHQGVSYPPEMALCLSRWYQDMWPANASAAYLESLQIRFANEPDKLAKAKGVFAAWLAHKLEARGVCEHCTQGVDLTRLRACLPAAKAVGHRLSTEFAIAAIRLDPQHRPHHDAALKLAERESVAEPLVDELMAEIAEQFDDDAAICAQMSRRLAARGELVRALEYARSAQKRASHDANLDDLVAALRLRQANETNARYAVLGCDADFLDAAALERPNIQPALQCGGLLGALQRQMASANEALEKLATIELIPRLRALGLIIAHLRPRAARLLIGQVAQLKAAFELLDEADMRRVMQAMDGTSALVFAIARPAAGLKALWRPFLLAVSDESLPEASLKIMEAGGCAEVVVALDKRQKHSLVAFSLELRFLRAIASCLAAKKAHPENFTDVMEVFSEASGPADVRLWFEHIARLEKVIEGDNMQVVRGGAAVLRRLMTSGAHTHCGEFGYVADEDENEDDEDSPFAAATADSSEQQGCKTGDFDADNVDALELLDADGPYQRSLSDAQLLDLTRRDKRIGPRAIKDLEKLVQMAGIPASPGPHHQRFVAALESSDDTRLLLRFSRAQLQLAPQTRTSPLLRRLLAVSMKTKFVPPSLPAESSAMEER